MSNLKPGVTQLDIDREIMSEDDEAARKEEEAYNEYNRQVNADRAAFEEKWPDYCRACGGWGKWSRPQTRWEPADGGPCESLPDGTCHRCNFEAGLTPDGDGPCSHCGWNYDDGLRDY